MVASSNLVTKDINSFPSPQTTAEYTGTFKKNGQPGLPPFEILLEWLNHYHTLTGNWPTPSSGESTLGAVDNVKVNPPTEVLRFPDQTVQEVSRESSFARSSSAGWPGSSYDYRGSIYYEVARQVAASFNTLSSSVSSSPLSPGALLVLASIIAWSQHPFFKEKCLTATAGNWMSLPLSRWSRELKMRKASLSAHLLELQVAGFISCGTIKDNILANEELQLLLEQREAFLLLTSDHLEISSEIERKKITNPRNSLGSTRIYRLRIAPSTPLPTFERSNQLPVNNPDVNGASSSQPSTNSGVGLFTPEPVKNIKAEPAINLTEAVPTKPEPLKAEIASGMAPCTCSYFIHDKNTDNHVINHGTSQAKISNLSLSDIQREPLIFDQPVSPGSATQSNGASDFEIENSHQDEIFTFLTVEAHFPGFSRSDGRQTLDEREARKFAFSPYLSLQKVKLIHSQVLSLWKAGKCTRNPIGFFHNRLSQRLSNLEALGGTGSRNRTLTVPEIPSTQALPVLPGVVSPAGSSPYQGTTSQANSVVEIIQEGEENETGPNEIESQSRNNITPDLLEDILPSLKQSVIGSLAGRYRHEELARFADTRDWKIASSGDEVQILLADEPTGRINPFYFGEADKALLQLVISQDLAYLVGQRVNIQLLTSQYNPVGGANTYSPQTLFSKLAVGA